MGGSAYGGALRRLPPLAAAMTNGAYAGLALVLVVFALGLSMGSTREDLRAAALSSILSTSVLCVAAAGVLFVTDAFHTRTRAQALLVNYQESTEELGGAASRTGVWKASLDTISRYPLMGVYFNKGFENMPDLYAGKGFYLSHNVFLDYGRRSGIPGMLLFAWFFFWPALRVFRQGLVIPYMPFLLALFAFLVFFMSLSFVFYKAFWGFWMLMALAAVRGPALAVERSRTKFRPKSRKPGDSSAPLPVPAPAPRAQGGDSSFR
jgi:O-antigen ligase